MILMHNVTNGFVIFYLYNQDQEYIDNHKELYQRELTLEFKITLIVMCSFNLLGLMFLANLITFHIELKYKGLTTYEYLKLKENITKESKIVVRVNQELRDEMKKDEEDRAQLKKEQAQLRI